MPWQEVANLEELSAAGKKLVGAGNHQVLLVYLEGQVHALENVCTHDGGPLHEGKVDPAKKCVVCPRHGAKFNLETGKPTFPAVRPVKVYPTRIEEGQVWLEV
jgi:nitrite reductase/ring-hydroxylating ferredoxin subunit